MRNVQNQPMLLLVQCLRAYKGSYHGTMINLYNGHWCDPMGPRWSKHILGGSIWGVKVAEVSFQEVGSSWTQVKQATQSFGCNDPCRWTWSNHYCLQILFLIEIPGYLDPTHVSYDCKLYKITIDQLESFGHWKTIQLNIPSLGCCLGRVEPRKIVLAQKTTIGYLNYC